jgi:hypothetical protein
VLTILNSMKQQGMAGAETISAEHGLPNFAKSREPLINWVSESEMLSGTKLPSKTQNQPVFKMLFASYQRFYPRYRRNSAALDKLVSIANQQVGKTEQQCDCRTKVVMSALSKVKVSSFAGVDFGGGVDQFEP